MAAPGAAPQPPPLFISLNEAEVKTTMPLPRAIQLVMAIVWIESSTATTTAASTKKTIGEFGTDRSTMWILFVLMPSIVIAAAAGITFAMLSENQDGDREYISGVRGFCFVAITDLAFGVYNAVLLVAGGHLALFAPRTPVAAWEAFHKGGCNELLGFIVLWTSFIVGLVGAMIDQAWTLPLVVAWTCLLGLLIASIVAFWLCVLRIYGGERPREKNSCGEAVIDGLAYLYCRLLYEYAIRLRLGKVAAADADADAGMQQEQLDAHVAVV